MTIIKYFLLIAVVFTTVSCSSSKSKEKMAEETAKEESKLIDSMMKAGYSQGIIVYSDKEGDCAYTILMEKDASLMYDPQNLDPQFQNNGQKVWFTFHPLRMPNRCDKANPVNISDIKVRE